mmetsp:Transcript_2582/g.9960  ORF Transcript_2582/g.9960 Transcript_2582/m.9960 type:complete len:281 (-) Transcript_2582:449-1291(-)
MELVLALGPVLERNLLRRHVLGRYAHLVLDRCTVLLHRLLDGQVVPAQGFLPPTRVQGGCCEDQCPHASLGRVPARCRCRMDLWQSGVAAQRVEQVAAACRECLWHLAVGVPRGDGSIQDGDDRRRHDGLHARPLFGLLPHGLLVDHAGLLGLLYVLHRLLPLGVGLATLLDAVCLPGQGVMHQVRSQLWCFLWLVAARRGRARVALVGGGRSRDAGAWRDVVLQVGRQQELPGRVQGSAAHRRAPQVAGLCGADAEALPQHAEQCPLERGAFAEEGAGQ